MRRSRSSRSSSPTRRSRARRRGWRGCGWSEQAMKNKIVSAAEAVAIIRDSDTVACSGFVGAGTPDELIIALEKRFLDTGTPRDFTLAFAAAPGDSKDRGMNRLAHPGLVKRVIGGHWALGPKLGKVRVGGENEAYNLPLGAIRQL